MSDELSFSWILSSVAVSTQDPAHIQESEIPLASEDYSCHQDVDLLAYNGLEPHMPTNVGSQVHQNLRGPEGGRVTS